MSDNRQRRYEFQLSDGRLLLVDHDNDETVADVSVNVPFGDGPAKNVRATERACQKVFGGHHWQSMSPRLSHEPEQRICVLCGRVEKHVDKWVDDTEADPDE